MLKIVGLIRVENSQNFADLKGIILYGNESFFSEYEDQCSLILIIVKR